MYNSEGTEARIYSGEDERQRPCCYVTIWRRDRTGRWDLDESKLREEKRGMGSQRVPHTARDIASARQLAKRLDRYATIVQTNG